MRSVFRLAAIGVAALLAEGGTARAADPACPAGPVHYGVIPFDSSAAFVPLYDRIGAMIADKLGCPVKVEIGTSYTATIEAMRAGKVDAAEFGPLSYVLAHQVAGAEAVATYADKDGNPDTYTASIVTWPGSGITTLKDVAGKTFAYSDPASTSGHLFPALGLAKAGIEAMDQWLAMLRKALEANYDRLDEVLAGMEKQKKRKAEGSNKR